MIITLLIYYDDDVLHCSRREAISVISDAKNLHLYNAVNNQLNLIRATAKKIQERGKIDDNNYNNIQTNQI